MSEYSHTYYLAHRDQIISRTSAYQKSHKVQRRRMAAIRRANHRKEDNAYARAWYANNKNKIRELDYQRKYGISIEQYEELLTKQDSKCAICGKTSERRLHVDHNHETGEIRGLLCGPCNWVLGLIHEDIGVLVSMLSYLEVQP